MVSVSSSAVEELKTATRGQLLLPGDAGYDEARSIWNAMIDRHPAMILRCAGVADVRRGVAFARDNDLPLAVRSGGHNIAGTALCDDGLVLDLSPMKSVQIDPAARRAYVEPGATLGDFDHEAQAFGLATPLGINSTTGVAGLTLGGGFGWLSRRYGMTVDNLISADVVTADGELVRASADSHEDLFWAIRGGGGNFGVVTRFEFALHPVGPLVYGGLVVLPLDQAKNALLQYRAAVEQMPEELSVWAVLRLAPPLPFLPPEVHGKPVIVFAMCYSGPVENGPSVVEAVRGFGTPVGEHLGPMPYAMWQQAFDPLLTPGARNYWKSHNLDKIPDGLIDALLAAIGTLPSPQCEIFFGQIGAQTSRVPVDATAYSSRDTQYAMNVHGRWDDTSDDERCIAWARAFFDAAAPFALGSVYVNFMTQEESGRVADAYGPNYERLVAVKKHYDPHNLFRHNQNIRPAA
ncbi:FAD-binding oxidoreductase [Paraburkholderia domus]|jgi:FAD/FMN-containing dehydrogenases|uniref:6-hydroxy-D-nicotine oxidase n=1 Tax=Paraburkholderia domus TaxID=2793075 RepID=A0A9N8QUX3_9BURK|nr:FAD-binding oxidoreductase [Paraburkholderia domus]MBK5065057.1 FAD-binding oxidoreductase [Burkholderia sp. R-70199]MBK5118695.1 FAD-binding oxidoreductase [Burkholderia sp. R-69980]MBK5164533.1 FAD-binding oxidoreductase [Burkholderia sp. R-70211]MBK5181772.1 FAD-binding oxidoreductase [Burkholderia sp. R-69749]MCI0144715.1 FAD-binding protein [Paraburkholderia sediminicola]